jgi:hypothetical protein
VSVAAGCSTSIAILHRSKRPTKPSAPLKRQLPGAYNPAPTTPPTPAPAITDEASRSALLSTRIIPRTAVRRGAASTVERYQAAAVVTVALAVLPLPRRPWLPSRKRRPHRRGSACPAGRHCGRGDRGCPKACRAVRPFPVHVASGSPWRAGGGDGVRPDTTGQAVSGRLSDRGVHRGRRTEPRGHRTGTRLADVPASSTGAGGDVQADPGAGRDWGWPKASMRIAVLSCPVRARTCRPRGRPWPTGQAHSRTLGSGGVRRLAVAVRTGSRAIGWAVTSNWGCPAERTVERSAMSVARPATAGCPQEELIGGDGVQTGVRRRHPGESGRPAGLWACPAHHGEILEVASGRSRVRCAGRRAAPARKPTSATDRAGGRVWGGWVSGCSVSGSRPSVLAGRAGL